MKILQLTKKFPYPLNSGESIAVFNLAKGLINDATTIDLLSLNTSKHYTDTTKLGGGLDHYNKIYEIYHENDVSYIGASLNLLTSESYHVQRLRSKDFELKLKELLNINKYDVIILETIYLGVYLSVIKQLSHATICLRAHNVEYEIWKRCSKEETSILKSWYLQLCAKRLKNFEIKNLMEYHLVLPLTKRDAQSFKKLGYHGDQIVIPVGLSLEDYQSDIYVHDSKYCFIGSLDWMPNTQGLAWFLSQVWPKVLRINPSLEFHIAGKNAPDDHGYDQIDGVFYHGEVDSATAFIKENGVLVVPLLSGSGIRVKILEAMAMQRPVITTTIGLEGIEASHGENVLIADTIEDYIKCFTDHTLNLDLIAKNARTFMGKNFDRDYLSRKLKKTLQERIGKTVQQQAIHN